MARDPKFVKHERIAKAAPPAVLSPSTLGRFFFHDCARFLAFKTAPSERRKALSLPAGRHDDSATMRALQESGASWEERVVTTHLHGKVEVSAGRARLAERAHTTEATLRHLHAGRSLYQATLQPLAGALGISAALARFPEIRPDLILAENEGGSTSFVIVDVKSSEHERFVHKIQVYLYARLLDEIVTANRMPTPVNLTKGGVWLKNQQKFISFPLAEVKPLVDRFLADDLPAILKAGPSNAFFALQSRCEWCDFHEHCRMEAEKEKDLSLLPGRSPSDKKFLLAAFGADDLPGLGVKLGAKEAAGTLRASAALKGRRSELLKRAGSLVNGGRVETGAASPSMPKHQTIALHLVLVPDNVTRGVAMAGYLLAMGNKTRDTIFKGEAQKPCVFTGDPAGFVRALHADLARIGAWNDGEEWKDKVSLVPFVYSNRERELLLALLFQQLTDAHGPRAETLDVLLLLQGAELADLEEAGDQPVQALPIVVVASEASRLFALPTAVSPTFPETLAALTGDSATPFTYDRHGLFDYPFGLALSDEALHKEPVDGADWLKSRIGQRLYGLQNLVWRIQTLAKDRLPSWPPKFSMRPSAAFNNPTLAQLVFVARYESVMACEKGRAQRFQSPEQMAEGEAVVRLRAERDGWFHIIDQASGARLEAGKFWLVEDSIEGHRESVALKDYYHGVARRTRNGGLWAPSAMATARLRQVELVTLDPEPPSLAARVRVKACVGTLPTKGQHVLFPCHADWNVTRVVEALTAIDAREDSPVHPFLADPVGFATARPLPREVKVKADTDAAFSGRRAAIWMAVRDQRMTALIGPPGTGKTYTLAQIVRALAKAHRDANTPFRALVTAFTNAAIDELHTKIKDKKVRDLDLHRISDGDKIDGLVEQAAKTKRPLVICTTTYQLLRKHAQQARFDLVIIDEASQMRLPEGVLAIDRLSPRGRLILCGDGEQLGPIFHGVYPEREDGDKSFNPAASAFTHALGALQLDHPSRAALEEGRRMNDVLTSVPAKLIYGPDLAVDFRPATKAIATRRLMLQPSTRRLPLRRLVVSSPVQDLARAALDPEVPLALAIVEGASSSRESVAEAEIVGAVGRELKQRLAGCTSQAEAKDKGLFVVAPHHVQIAAIRRRLAADFDTLPLVDTVEKMQGQTCEVVVVSYGVADAEVAMAEDTFIYDRNRLNVAISRARSKAILVVSRPLLEPPPRILDSVRASKGFAYLRAIHDRAEHIGTFSPLISGTPTKVALRGLRSPMEN